MYENVVKVASPETPLHPELWIDSGDGLVDPVSGADCSNLNYEITGSYGLRIIVEPLASPRSWTPFERTSIMTGIERVGTAFDYLAVSVNTPWAAFNLVMLENSGTEILFIRTESTASTVTVPNYTYLLGTRAGQTATLTYPNAADGYCISHQEAVAQGTGILMPAAIICNSDLIDQYDGTDAVLQASQYTVVHELGHVFDYRTGQGLSDPIDGSFFLPDCNNPPGMVMGTIEYWTRGGRGWGTGPAHYYSNGNAVPLVTNFQQNPENTPIEAAADSFLNWVYRLNASGGVRALDSCALTPTPFYNSWSGPGFLNLQWSTTAQPPFPANSNGIAGSGDNSLPGDARYFDIDSRIRTLFLNEQW
ncbi:MAG: hypothetical protein IAE80_29290 [Anaerolinea sp.]|nr:hypothetical protein [Anaerolinea sp.]